MGRWAVETKIRAAAVKQNSNKLLPRQISTSPSLYQICQNRASYSLLSYNVHHKHKISTLPTISSSLISKTIYMLFQTSYFSTATQPFDEMLLRSRHPGDTRFYYVLDVLKSCCLRPDIVTSVIVHCLALKVGALAHLPICTSLLTVYSRAGDFGSSRALFDEICDRDVIFWNAMITASVENRCFGAAVDIFVEMTKQGSGFDSTTLLVVASALSHMNYLRQGRVLHGLSLKAGMLLDSSLCNALIGMHSKCGDLSSSECMFAENEYRDIVSWNAIMSGCLYNNCPEKSLWYFREMARLRERADNVSLPCAISASACLGELSSGQVIHGWAIKLGYTDSSHISVTNSLISLYSECGDIEAAEILFKGITCKDVVSWNAMIAGFSLNGNVLEAFELLREMQLTGSVQPDQVTIVTTIPLCSEFMLLREGRAIHGFTIRRGMNSDLSVANSLMDMYSKCSSIRKSELLFNAMPNRDLVSWNTMISGISQNGQSREAQDLFKEMLSRCLKCSLSTLLAIFPSCNSPEFLCFGKLIHCWQLKSGFSDNVLAVNSLMFMYINCGDLAAAFSLLRRISDAADVACWNTVIAGCAQNGNFREALRSFNVMRWESHVSHDTITLVSVISACGNLEHVFEGKFIHGLALKTSMGSDTRVQNALITMYSRCGEIESARSVFISISNRNLCSWNCMISAFAQNKDGQRALELFGCLEFKPNEISIVGILSACTQLGLLRHGKQIHGCVLRFGFEENSFISAALVDMYSNCGRLDFALHIFRNSQDKSVASWNSMISAYGFHSNGRKAIEVFHEMCEFGIRATKSTFISLLSACSHSGLVNEGLWYYNHMQEKFGVEPVTEHHVCMVDMLGRFGKLHEAYEFIERMPTKPEPGVWGALLSACNYHGDIAMGREVAELLFKLEPENVGYYISLSNMHVAAGQWKDAVELRKIVQDKQLKKPAGYSLIDVGLG